MAQLQNIPAFKFSILFVAGILIGSEYFPGSILIMFVILLIIVITIIVHKSQDSKFVTPLVFTLIILFGIHKSNVDFFYNEENSIRFIPDSKKNVRTELIGIISQLPDYDSSRIRLVIKCNFIISLNDTFKVTGTAIAEIRRVPYKKGDSPPPDLNAGDRISLTGSLAAPVGKRNPGEFDYRKYLEFHGIYKIFSVHGFENVSVISEDHLGFFYSKIIFPAKKLTLQSIDRNIHGDESAYLKSLVTGERGDISSEMKEDFVNAGVMHLIAVSGLNVAYIIIFITLILSLLRIPFIARTFITIFFLIFYCLFTGNSSSIVRASIMGILVLLAFMIERRINFFNVIGVSAIIILIYDSKQIFDAGFILSYSATLSMAVFLSRFENLFIKTIREWNVRGKKIAIWISVLFFTSLAAQIGTIPITVSYFGKLSIISILSNIIAVPLANISLAIGFFQIIAAVFSEYLAAIISQSNDLLLSFQLIFIKQCAKLDFAFIYVKELSGINILCYYTVLFLLLAVNNIRKILFHIVLCILVITGDFIINYDFTKQLQITFLDVGQGDCSLIRTPDNKIILIDCGIKTYKFNSGERTIAPYLRRTGINKIDLLIITHLHLDHIGGIIYLLENFKIEKIIESGQSVRSSFISKMDSVIKVKNIPREIVRSGDLIDDLENIRLYYLFPANNFVSEIGYTLNNNLNNGSVAFKLKYKEIEIFFSGDIEKEGEKFLYDMYADFLKTDILKVAHHGSATSTTIPFIIKNKPSYAVISCGLFNKFNHPSDIILNRLENSGAIICRTDFDGALIFESDGSKIERIEWK